MASLAQTVTNTLLVLGASPCNVWNTLEWGTDNWGPDLDVATEVDMAVTNSTGITTSTQRDVVWDLVYSNTLDIEDAFPKEIEVGFADSVTTTSAIGEVLRSIGDYDYIASRPTTNWVDQVLDDSSKVSDPTDNSTKVTNPSTTWTEV